MIMTSLREYQGAIQGGRRLMNVTGIVGRLLRGKTLADFETLTDDPQRRKVVMLTDSEGMEKLTGQTGYQICRTVGWDEDFTEDQIVRQGKQAKLVAFEEGGEVVPATWDAVANVIRQAYPLVHSKFMRQLRELRRLRTQDFKRIEDASGFNWAEVDKAGSGDPRYMTYERYQNATDTVWAARAFLYFTLYLKELYMGDGYTYDRGGNRGVKEYLVVNKPLRELGNYVLIDIDVKIPTAGAAIVVFRQHGELELPSFFNSDNCRIDYRPNKGQLREQAEMWRQAHNIPAAAKGGKRIALMLIDVQNDFCYPEGTLYVAGRSGRGAIDDSVRMAAFIYRNIPWITSITMTMDTHTPHQIFYPSFWRKRDGSQPSVNTIISADDVRSGAYVPDPAMAALFVNGNYGWLRKYVEHYCSELEKAGKYQLFLWPEHCMIGDVGHALVGLVDEARTFHALVRKDASDPEIKGGNPLTENYSIFRPEVTLAHDGQTVAQKNSRFLKRLLDSDYVIVGGQAASHCVKASTDDFLNEIMAKDPRLARKVYVLADCMSAVVIPAAGLDYTPQAEEALARYRDAGMHVVKST